MEFGKYQFLSWARRGIGRNIIEKDLLGAQPGTAEQRAKIPVTVKINESINNEKEFALLGPGDITGIQQKVIIRTEPLNGISDFEPNLLPYIEFYDEDFPWRFTPASPAGSNNRHLRPWLALIVLKENEFINTDRRKPLPSIKMGSADFLPPANELHLWAHMHSNLAVEHDNFETFITNLEEEVKTDPDGVYSRILCPRKLEPRTLYHAFLIPSYETGRLAGLGQPTAGIKAQQHAFAADLEFPVYHRWYFRTGDNVDFESLVKLLEPRAMDEKVGVRPMDCSKPAFVRADKDEEVTAPEPNILLLEGALKSPKAPSTPFPKKTNQPFLNQVKDLLNLNLIQQENEDEDPYVSLPYYGMYHIMRKNSSLPGKKEIPPFDPVSGNWSNDLNRDPRNRVPAGFGARVVQQNQEKFMDKAWAQLENVLEANRKMKLLQFMQEVMDRTFKKYVAFRKEDGLIGFTTRLNTKILFEGGTVTNNIRKSRIPNQVLDFSFPKFLRKNQSITKNLNINNPDLTFGSITAGLNKEKGISIDPKAKYSSVSEIKKTGVLKPESSITQINTWSTASNLEPNYVYNLNGFTGGLPSVLDWSGTFKPVKILKDRPDILVKINQPQLTAIELEKPGTKKPSAVSGLKTVPNNVLNPGNRLTLGHAGNLPPIAMSGTIKTNLAVRNQPSVPVSVTTSPQSMVTKLAADNLLVRDDLLVSNRLILNKLKLSEQNAGMQLTFKSMNLRNSLQFPKKLSPSLKTNKIGNTIKTNINPRLSYVQYKNQIIKWPKGIKTIPNEEFLPAMAYPDFPEPVYKYLTDIDNEFLLPNLKLIPPNTLSLLRTNQKFIESYLVGINYEMGKELMWREYPTDMRGSYFRQFWDVNGLVKPGMDAADVEKLKDIIPIHKWSSTSLLGSHNQRDTQGGSEQLVFVIKGDLLKKFPNTVIYAQKAINVSGKKKIRVDLTDAQFAKEVRFPLYKAQIVPDIYLLGFDLTIEEASGKAKTTGFGNDKLGWFFVIAEVPGEPRFGMDVQFKPDVPGKFTWNDLSWKNFENQLDFVKATIPPSNTEAPLPDGDTGTWGRTAEDMAAILFQRPVMVPVHASEMLDVGVSAVINGTEKLMTLIQFVRK